MTTQPPAARSFWPRAIIAYFAVVISCIVVFVAWVVRQNNDLVRPDYYAEELRFQTQMERVQRTRELHQRATIRYDYDKNSLAIALPAEHIGRISSGTIQLYRPSDAGLDRKFDLAPDVNGTQQLNASELEGGLWKVHLFWTCNEQEFYFEQSVILKGRES